MIDALRKAPALLNKIELAVELGNEYSRSISQFRAISVSQSYLVLALY